MAVRTEAELQAALDNSFSWRRIELAALRAEVERSADRGPASPLTRALARGSLALLYAHWEGFTQEGLRAYVEFLGRRRMKYEELNDGLLKTVFHALHRRASSGDPAAQEALIDAVRRPQLSRAIIPRNSMVNTRSNLRFEVLCEILNSVGLDSADFETKAQLIDRSLCDARNDIAHGRDRFPSAQEFGKLHDVVLAMMESVRDKVLEAARTKAYMA